jgi:hypothetical protein
MAMFCFYCRDGEDGGKRRALHRAAHLEFLAQHSEHYAAAGPLKNSSGEIVGSLLIVTAADESAARKWLNDDPYLIGGVWQSVRVDGFEVVAGTWAQ